MSFRSSCAESKGWRSGLDILQTLGRNILVYFFWGDHPISLFDLHRVGSASSDSPHFVKYTSQILCGLHFQMALNELVKSLRMRVPKARPLLSVCAHCRAALLRIFLEKGIVLTARTATCRCLSKCRACQELHWLNDEVGPYPYIHTMQYQSILFHVFCRPNSTVLIIGWILFKQHDTSIESKGSTTQPNSTHSWPQCLSRILAQQRVRLRQ